MGACPLRGRSRRGPSPQWRPLSSLSHRDPWRRHASSSGEAAQAQQAAEEQAVGGPVQQADRRQRGCPAWARRRRGGAARPSETGPMQIEMGKVEFAPMSEHQDLAMPQAEQPEPVAQKTSTRRSTSSGTSAPQRTASAGTGAAPARPRAPARSPRPARRRPRRPAGRRPGLADALDADMFFGAGPPRACRPSSCTSRRDLRGRARRHEGQVAPGASVLRPRSSRTKASGAGWRASSLERTRAPPRSTSAAVSIRGSGAASSSRSSGGPSRPCTSRCPSRRRSPSRVASARAGRRRRGVPCSGQGPLTPHPAPGARDRGAGRGRPGSLAQGGERHGAEDAPDVSATPPTRRAQGPPPPGLRHLAGGRADLSGVRPDPPAGGPTATRRWGAEGRRPVTRRGPRAGDGVQPGGLRQAEPGGGGRGRRPGRAMACAAARHVCSEIRQWSGAGRGEGADSGLARSCARLARVTCTFDGSTTSSSHRPNSAGRLPSTGRCTRPGAPAGAYRATRSKAAGLHSGRVAPQRSG